MSSPFTYEKRVSDVPFTKILTMPANSTHSVTVLCEQPLGYSVHWFKRAHLCSGEGCPGCRSNPARCVYGFLCDCRGELCFAEVGITTAATMFDTATALGLKTWAGSRWFLSKTRYNGTVQAKFHDQIKSRSFSQIVHLRVLARLFGLADVPASATVQQAEALIAHAAEAQMTRVTTDLRPTVVRT